MIAIFWGQLHPTHQPPSAATRLVTRAKEEGRRIVVRTPQGISRIFPSATSQHSSAVSPNQVETFLQDIRKTRKRKNSSIRTRPTEWTLDRLFRQIRLKSASFTSARRDHPPRKPRSRKGFRDIHHVHKCTETRTSRGMRARRKAPNGRIGLREHAHAAESHQERRPTCQKQRAPTS